MALDEYEPALTDTATDESGAESTITTRTAEQKAEPVIQAGEAGDDPSKPPGARPRGQRQLSDKTRAMIRALAASSAKSEAADLAGVADDLVPMGTDNETSPAAAGAVAAEVSSSPSVEASPAAAAAVPAATSVPAAEIATYVPVPVPAAAAAPVQPAGPDPRDKLYADREALIAQREKMLPNIDALIEKPGATLAAWLKSVYGVTDEAEFEQVIADVTAELSEVGLKTKLPADYKAGLESRKATRTVRAIRADLGKREADIAAQQSALAKAADEAKAAAEQQQYEQNALARVNEMIAPTKASAQYLHNPDVTDGIPAHVIVWDVIKEQDKIARKWLADHPGNHLPEQLKPSIERAVSAADAFYKKQAEALIKRVSTIATAPAKAAASPGPTAASGPPAAKQPPARPAAQPVIEQPDEEIQFMDRRDRRAANAKALWAKHFGNKNKQPTQ